jgi:hypothetical protein
LAGNKTFDRALSEADAGRRPHTVVATGSHNIAPVSFIAAAPPVADQDTPSLVRAGTLRLRSNVGTFARKFPVTLAGFEAADLSFCPRHQVNLHCGEIINYATEGAVSMRCSLVILDPAEIVTP